MAKNAAAMLDMIADGRTDLVIDYLAQGGAAGAVAGESSLVSLCAYYGDVTAIKFLLAQGAALDTIGDRPLFNAAFFGHHRLCRFLLDRGFDPNEPEPDTGETPLHAATSKLDSSNYDDTLRVLVAGGANPNAVTTPGVHTSTLMRDAVTRGETPLHRAAAYGNHVSIRVLLDAGATIDARDANGETPLGWASWHRRPVAILALLCYGRFVGTITPRHVEADRSYFRAG